MIIFWLPSAPPDWPLILKGLIGESAYETGAWLRNPHPELLNSPYPARTLAHRIDQLASVAGA